MCILRENTFYKYIFATISYKWIYVLWEIKKYILYNFIVFIALYGNAIYITHISVNLVKIFY